MRAQRLQVSVGEGPNELCVGVQNVGHLLHRPEPVEDHRVQQEAHILRHSEGRGEASA